jgi:putative membrane-bound dehydrogenase-like protein
MKRHLVQISVLLLAVSIGTPLQGQVLSLQLGDRICLVGNELGERMQHHNHWETALHARFPELELVVRNLCFPGDEPFERLRSLNFGEPDKHLTRSRASVLLFFFGYGESFGGREGLESFAGDLTRLIEETKKQDYSGEGPARIVLISPIAFNDTGDPNLPNGVEHNERLELYAGAMRYVAERQAVGFVDLFTPTQEMFALSPQRLTRDGAHLNDAGYVALAPILVEGLFGPGDPNDAVSKQPRERLRAEIGDKNFHWWHRYRAVNGYSIYGTRSQAGFDGTYRNRDVMERERTILDQMCANRDQRIWELARGHRVPEAADDSNTLPFILPKTNVGGPDDKNREAGKLGTLDYLNASEQEKRFKLAPGYEINLFASEEDFPELANPVAMNFDNAGRLWVSVMPSYPQWQPKTKLDDKLLILEDHNHDGRADVCKVFAGGLHQPTGFELGHNGVFVAQQPDVLFLTDEDGDDRADTRIRRLVGFDTADSHHGLAAFEWGPGGALYFQEGTFKQSQVETIEGNIRLSDAGVWRYEPRSEKFSVHVSLAMANPWGHVFDRWGQNFIADASPGHNFWATPISGFVAYPDKHAGGGRANKLDWGGSKSDKVYPTFIEKRIRPSSGCELVSSRNFPSEAQGNYLLNNVISERTVLQHSIRDDGSGFIGEEVTPLVACQDGNFRPVDLQFGPDGALYIVDWHNALIGHLQHNLRDPNRDHRHGRIWRVVYRDRPLLDPPKIAGAAIDDLLELLKEPEDRTRYRVRRELAQRESAEVIAEANRWMASFDSSNRDLEHWLLEALWLHQSHNTIDQELLLKLLEAKDPRARAAATRVLCYWRDRVTDSVSLLKLRVDDPHPRVRLEAVRACSFFPADDVQEAVLEVLNHEMDEYLEYTLDETLRALER